MVAAGPVALSRRSIVGAARYGELWVARELRIYHQMWLMDGPASVLVTLLASERSRRPAAVGCSRWD